MEDGDRDRPPPTRQSGEHPFAGPPYTPIPYQPEYPQDSQIRPQSYPPYSSTLDYGMANQPTNQTYAPMQSYPPRQNAAIEVLPPQFSAPASYYGPGDSPTPAGPSPTPHHHHQHQHQHQHQNQHHQQPQQQQPQLPPAQFSSPSYANYGSATAPLSQPPYPPSVPDLNPPPAVSEPPDEADYAQQQQQQQQQDQQSQQHQPLQQQQNQTAALDEAYARYQTALKLTFQNMREGRLGEAGASLLAITEWLLSNAVELGLVRDEQELHGDRTRLWNEFNTCWLSVLDKQKEMLREFVSTGQPPQAPRELLRDEVLDRMGRELIRLCDGMERHGLVDYQMGVWEEEIIEAIQDCLDLMDDAAIGNPPEGSTTSDPGRSR